MVEGLQRFEIYQLGSSAFLRQHNVLQKLNLQAHQNYVYQADEWVSEMLNDLDKWDVLIYNLLVCFEFRTRYFPQFFAKENRAAFAFDDESSVKASVLFYALFFHEAVIIDLLSVRIVDQLPKCSCLLDLTDYLSV